MSGFYLAKLSVQGVARPAAEIHFFPGCNVVAGASDTGKSYLFSLINYIFGKKEQPKKIVESIGYEYVLAEIHTFENDTVFTLHREFNDNVITVKECYLEEFLTSNVQSSPFRTLGDVSHSQHISSFLMNLSGLPNKKVLKNKTTGRTENLGFSSLRKLLWVNEVDIVKVTSPFYFSGGNSNYIKDQAVLKLLMSGEDFSAVQLKEDRTTKETKIVSKIDFIINRIDALTQEKNRAVALLHSNDPKNENAMRRLNAQLEADLSVIDEITVMTSQLQARRLNLTNELSYNNELEKRFDILSHQYRIDSERLEFILEADVLSAQLGESLCPICSSPINKNSVSHFHEIEEFRASVRSELQKIKSKLVDLQETSNDVKVKGERLKSELNTISGELDELSAFAAESVNPRVADTKMLLSDIFEQRNTISRINFIDDEVKNCFDELDRLQKLLKIKTPEDETPVIEYPYLSELCAFIEHRLERWNYESGISVVFNSHYKTFDIAISGKERQSYGKGKRAISYSACVLGLLDYCTNYGSQFSNFIMLDSPLTTFEEKKTQTRSELTAAVQSAFFSDLANTPTTCQVIIFDNKEPSAELRDFLNTQIFTGNSSTGRKGFFPD